jgi:hypothetical protein
MASFRFFLGKTRRVLHQLAQKCRNEMESRERTEDDRLPTAPSAPTLHAELHIPESVIERITTPNREENRREDKKVIIEAVTLLVVLIYSIFSGLQWRELNTQAKTMHNTLKFEQERFVSEQRPYIWFVSEKPVMQVGSPLTWSLTSENDGRSAALKMRSCVALLVRQTDDRVHLDERFKDDVPAPSFNRCAKRAEDENRGLAPPGGRTVQTASDGVVSQKQIDYANKVFGTLVIEAISEYQDSGGNHYLTTFCDVYVPTGHNVQCPYYNDVK